jgi:uncharacterized protein (UPF0216 family)
MNLIDKYIAEVGKHLPRRNRSDIEAEIRSTLEDMLDERKQATARRTMRRSSNCSGNMARRAR